MEPFARATLLRAAREDCKIPQELQRRFGSTSGGRSWPHAKTAAARRPFGVNGRGEFEADSTLIAVQAMAVDNFGVDVKVADQLTEDQLIVWLPVPMGKDAGALTADVYNHDCLDNWRYPAGVQTCSKMHSGPMFIPSRYHDPILSLMPWAQSEPDSQPLV
jgi:hypothetical protein